MVGGVSPGLARLSAWAMVVAAIAGCAPAGTASPPNAPVTVTSSAPTSSPTQDSRTVILVGRILTMDEPPVAGAMLIEDGIVAAVGNRDEVLALAGEHVPVIDIGRNVAYPGFVDAHAHWIGDRDHYGLKTAAEAMEAALSRGWTSISEQWVNPERLDELERLAANAELAIRVDAYLALNAPEPGGEHFGNWYADREPGPITDRLRVQGVKIHLDTGFELDLLWEADELNVTVAAANQAGWQVSMHAFSKEAQEMALDALEKAIGPNGPNPLRHRIEHNIQVTDAQLARMVALNVPTVIHLDTAVADWLGGPDSLADLGGDTAWLTRWKDFADAGLHVAAATDMPWILPDFKLTDDIGRPVDQIAGGMDPRGRTYPEPPAWMASQLLTAEQGLRAVTLDAAYGLRDEAKRGHLAVGTYGDVTILSGDLTGGATPDEIRAMTVIATIVGGAVAFCGDRAVCVPASAP